GTRITSSHKPHARVNHWCGVKGDDVNPTCDATVSNMFDADGEWGAILLATDLVHVYAQARFDAGDENNLIYAILHDGNMNHQSGPAQEDCIGCRPESRPLSAKVLSMFEPRHTQNPP